MIFPIRKKNKTKQENNCDNCNPEVMMILSNKELKYQLVLCLMYNGESTMETKT